MEKKVSIDNLGIHGHSDNVFKYMFQADLLIFTSRAEAFPRTVAEYMGVGKPIIAADVSGVNEMIIDEENGLLFNPFKKESLLNVLTKYLREEEQYTKLGEEAWSFYYSIISKKNHIDKFIQITKSF